MCTRDCYRYKHVYTYRKKKFKNIIERNYVLALDSYKVFTKKVLMEFACIRNSRTLQKN